jgi:putative ABC transport system ATP-binding protein
MQPVIIVEHVRKSYHLDKTEVPALKDLDLAIEEGEFTVLAGPSGSGKTTLLNIIGCIDKPDSGRLVLNGEDVTARSLNSLASVRRDRLGYIFQSFNLIPVLTAYENVEYPLLLTKISANTSPDSSPAAKGSGLQSRAPSPPDQRQSWPMNQRQIWIR